MFTRTDKILLSFLQVIFQNRVIPGIADQALDDTHISGCSGGILQVAGVYWKDIGFESWSNLPVCNQPRHDYGRNHSASMFTSDSNEDDMSLA
mmetsp:Transcript_1916/g.4192  ORF Transcript_1916/g.4192 Transcript_1916/m.4192 type:complete len:93 (-) Transcript_1916:50-328(-)